MINKANNNLENNDIDNSTSKDSYMIECTSQLVSKEEKSALTIQAEKMHPLATALQVEFPIDPAQYSTEHPITSPKPHSKIFRCLQALLFPIFLVVSSSIVLLVVGNQGLTSLGKLINKYWSIANILRLVVYFALSWVALPKLLLKLKHQKLLELHYLYEEAKRDPLCDLASLWEIERRMQNVAHIRLSPWLCLMILIIFDFVVVQLPFLLK